MKTTIKDSSGPHCRVTDMGRNGGIWAIAIWDKGNNKITELRAILQRESQNS